MTEAFKCDRCKEFKKGYPTVVSENTQEGVKGIGDAYLDEDRDLFVCSDCKDEDDS